MNELPHINDLRRDGYDPTDLNADEYVYTMHTHATPTKPQRYTISYAAKLLGWGEKKLFAWLRAHHYINADNMAYQRYINAGYFCTHCGQYDHPRIGQKFYARTDLTNAGLVWLAEQLEAPCPPKPHA